MPEKHHTAMQYQLVLSLSIARDLRPGKILASLPNTRASFTRKNLNSFPYIAIKKAIVIIMETLMIKTIVIHLFKE